MKNASYVLIGLTSLTFLSACTFAPPDGGDRKRPSSQSSGSIINDGLREGRAPSKSDSVIEKTPSDTTTSVDMEQSEGANTSSIPNTSTQDIGQTYTKTLSYSTPSHQGQTNTQFSVTVDNGIITVASAQYISGDHEDQRYQSRFSNSIASAVIGKKLSDISLDVVGGASLTTEAFQEFIGSI